MNRLQQELNCIKLAGIPLFRDDQVEDFNLYNWRVLLMPDKAPYNEGAFRVEIKFSRDFRIKPPKIIFKTKIYHPNVAEDGQVFLAALQSIDEKNWSAGRIKYIVESLLALINQPDLEHSLRADVHEEFVNNYETFFLKAKKHTLKYAEKRRRC